MACLTLVATGMTAEDRETWCFVARQSLTGIPADLLRRGCHKARQTCRFAADIVPTILGEIQVDWDWRRRRLIEERQAETDRNRLRLEAPIYPTVPHEETQRILREVREQFPSERESALPVDES